MTEAGVDLRRQLGSLLSRGQASDAASLLGRLADEGNADAQYELGLWRLYGQYVDRDPEAAARLFRSAAGQHHAEAIAADIALLANGLAGPDHPDAAIRAVRARAPSDPRYAGQLAALEMLEQAPMPVGACLSQNPDIRLFADALPPGVCDYVMDAARSRLAPSFVVDPATRRRVPHPVRTSHGTNFGPVEEDCVINAINRRIAAITGTDWRAGEMLHVLRYTPGQQYRLHHDGLPQVTNQRQWTAIVYLNEAFEGGATDFPLIGLQVAPRRGAMLLFANTTADGAIDSRTRHAGTAVDRGEKWVATRWIRTRKWTPWCDDAAA
ncbi:2OG-Fe(II) oxygenase [Blastomonas sp.]|uniref:2OG-Fe(II) oxygenase n=1 Tax=Blastomonas sp. TaxID=1909299 RepID=UPI0026157C3B|nr:2OG-Fe(II) oxygenase [Blastomonas sp.]MDM7955851.1 2OG-Fe(II) oxygenase [Blastomonas sp.]